MPHEKKVPTRVWPVLKVYTRAMLQYPLTLVSVLVGVAGLQFAVIAAPLYLKRLVDILSTSTPSADAAAALMGILGVYAVLGATKWVSQRLQRVSLMRMESQVMRDLTNYGFGVLLAHSHDFFISNFAGTLTRRVTRFARAFEPVFDSVIFNFIPLIVFSAGSVIVLYGRSPWLGTALLLWVITFVTIQLLLGRWRQPLRVQRAAEDSRVTGALADAVGNHSAISLFAAGAYEQENFRAVVESWYLATKRSWNSDSVIVAVQHALGIAIELALLTMGVLLWQRGLMTVGDFILIQVYVLGVFDQVWYFGNNVRRLYDSFAEASEMLEIIDLAPGIQDVLNAETLAPAEGVINFAQVRFHYNEERPILQQFDLEVRGGEKIALVGSSGAGKSTVTKLLLRQYDATGGSITIDGQDITKVTQDSLHRAIAYVPQESILFHRTLRENIAYGKRDATEEEIVAAATAAHCHEFIAALPQGYDTYVGERGVKLSGGERQRVAIARAILKNAPILVLDEATSSLDSESEALIQDALAKLMEGKTVIAIAHRLSTIMKMDRIIVMEHGEVAIMGTHDELLAHESNLYKKLWEIQAGSFIPDES